MIDMFVSTYDSFTSAGYPSKAPDKRLNMYLVAYSILRNFILERKQYKTKIYVPCFMFHLESHPGKKGWFFLRIA